MRELPDAKAGAYTSYDARQKTSILASLRAQVDDALWSPQGGLRQLIAGQTAFYDTNTATLLGLQLAPGGPLQPAQVNAAQRLGILTHPAIMATFASATGSHPIRRGTFVWDRILCQPLPNPPANVPAFPGIPPHTSLRQAFERFDAPASCQSCHARIDPVGFPFEAYDTLGAYRTVDDYGMPIDSAATIVGADDDAQSGQSTPQLLAGLTRSRSFLMRKNVE